MVAQPRGIGGLDGERPEVEKHHWVLRRDLRLQARIGARREERSVRWGCVCGSVVYRLYELNRCCGAEGVACEGDGAGFVNRQEVREHCQYVLPAADFCVFGDVLETLACIDPQQSIMDQTHLPKSDAQLFVAGVVDIGRGLVVDSLVVYALGLLLRIGRVDEVYGRATVTVIGCYDDDSVASERTADVRVCVS